MILQLFAPPPANDPTAYTAVKNFAAITSVPRAKAFYYHRIATKENRLSRTLMNAGEHAAVSACGICKSRPGRHVRGKVFFDTVQFADLTGFDDVYAAAIIAAEHLKRLTIEMVDVGPDIEWKADYSIRLRKGVKCNPEVYAQYIWYFVGFWNKVDQC